VLPANSNLLVINSRANEESDNKAADESDLTTFDEEEIRNIEKRNAMKIVAVNSLLNIAHKAEREGNRIKAEEFYKRIITYFPDTREALSAKSDLLEINPNAIAEMEHNALVEKELLDSKELLSAKPDISEINPNALDEIDEIIVDESDQIISYVEKVREIEKGNAIKIVGVDSLLNIARKAEREGNWIRAEEFYKRIINDYPESQEALSAKLDLLEINPTATVEMEKELTDEEKISAIKQRSVVNKHSAMKLQNNQMAKTLSKVISLAVIGLFVHQCSVKPKLANSKCSPYSFQHSSLHSQCMSCEKMPFSKWDSFQKQCRYFTL
jgi:tetratricopeptide (TPR) repeat protein